MRAALVLVPADVRHAAALARFERRAFVGVYAPHRFTERQFRALLRGPRTIARMALEDGAIVGYSLGIRHSGSRAHLCRLDSIAVARAFRRRSLGGALLRAFLGAARESGCTAAVLEVAAARRGARALFARNGFEASKLLPDYYGPGMDGIRMRRLL